MGPESHAARARSDAGFSLMELLVALVILGLVMSMIPRTIALASRAFRAADVIEARSAESVAIDFLAARLSEAMPLYRRSDDGLLAIAFSGGERTLSFVAPLKAGKGATGLAYFTLSAGQGRDGADGGVTLTWQLFRAETQPDQPAPPQNTRTLLPSSVGFAFRYRGRKDADGEGGIFGASADEAGPATVAGEWQLSWPNRELLPNDVEITYKSVSGRLHTRTVDLKLVTQR